MKVPNLSGLDQSFLGFFIVEISIFDLDQVCGNISFEIRSMRYFLILPVIQELVWHLFRFFLCFQIIIQRIGNYLSIDIIIYKKIFLYSHIFIAYGISDKKFTVFILIWLFLLH